MQTIFALNQAYSFADVKAGNFHFSDEYFQHTFNFCKKWLNGTSHFTFNTSGSTGSPKIFDAQRHQMLASAQGTIAALGLTANEHILLCISTKMIGGAMMLVRALELGCDLTIVNPNSNPLENCEVNHHFTLASFVPMQVYEIQNDSLLAQKLQGFKNILLGGAPACSGTLTSFGQLSNNVWQTYGMTETLSHIALKKVGRDNYYTTLPGVKIKIDDHDCLCIEAEVTDNQWLITNDVINLIDDTHFELRGRIDDVINSGGIKIFSYDVEHAIMEKFAAIEMPPKPLFVCRQPDDKYGETVVVIMLGEPLDDAIIAQLIQHCKDTLGKYAAPKHFYFVNEFEKLESGKLDKKNTLNKIINQHN